MHHESFSPFSDEIQMEVQQEKDLSNDLDQKIAEFQKKIRSKKISLGGGGTEYHAHVMKQERVLENRLDTVR